MVMTSVRSTSYCRWGRQTEAGMELDEWVVFHADDGSECLGLECPEEGNWVEDLADFFSLDQPDRG